MTGHQPIVVVLSGGPDAEREVSLSSGHAIATALRQAGRFVVVEKVIDQPSVEELRVMEADVFFPALHGRWGEGGPLQSLLETIDVPFVGSGSAAAALAMDKLRTKQRLTSLQIATPDAILLAPDDLCPITPPLVLKPNDDGSSVDMRICHTEATVIDARAALHPRRATLLAERYIAGRELTVGVLHGKPLPLIEIRPDQSVEFYDYDAKYTRDDTAYVVSPDLPSGVAERCTQAAVRAFSALGCCDLARVDFILDEHDPPTPWFLEINTMPGFTSHSLLPMAAAAAGIALPTLVAGLVDAALERATPARSTSIAAPVDR